jgi:hypothetical protein
LFKNPFFKGFRSGHDGRGRHRFDVGAGEEGTASNGRDP